MRLGVEAQLSFRPSEKVQNCREVENGILLMMPFRQLKNWYMNGVYIETGLPQLD